MKWCFTWNNPNDLTQPGQMPGIRYLITQYEYGDSGTPHLQGYVWFQTRKRLSAVRRLLPRANWLPARGTAQQNKTYCSKEEGRIAGPWEIGTIPANNGHRNVTSMKYATLQDDLDEGMKLKEVSTSHFEMFLKHNKSIQQYRLQQMEPRDFKTTVIFMYGPAGAGKTHFVKEQDPKYWRKPLKHWFDAYDGEETVLYDDFVSTNYGSITGHLAAFDKYKYTPKVHFGFCQWRPRVIFITSNLLPEELFPELQTKAPALVKAFWERVEFIIQFGVRDYLTAPPRTLWHPSYPMPMLEHGYIWDAGYKRGH